MTLAVRLAALAAIVAFEAVLPAPALAIPVEPQHAVYDFLRRQAVKGRFSGSGPFLNSLPLQQAEILDHLESLSGRTEGPLSAWEQGELERYLREFNPELRSRDTKLAYRDDSRTLFGDVSFYMAASSRDSLPGSDAYLFSTVTPRISGSWGGGLGFISEASVSTERSSTPRFRMNYDPQRGLPYNAQKGRFDGKELDAASTFDAFRTVLSLGNRHYWLEFGNDWNQWGPGRWQHAAFGPHPWFWVQDSLAPSDSAGFTGSSIPGGHRRGFRFPGEAAPMTQLRTVFTWHFLRYTKFYGEKTGLTPDAKAYLIAHRLEAKLGGRFTLGLFEAVAFAGRSFELTYALPFVPLKFAEHQLGDRDNISLGFDMDWNPAPGWRVYTELFLDDLLAPQDLLGSYWGNKFAWTLGAEAFDFLFPSSSLALEYARVEPWLFGHHKYNNQMQHFGALLGSSLPPNSHVLRMAWSKELPLGFRAGVEYGYFQRQMRDRGGSIFDFHFNDTDGLDKEFLGDNPETRHVVQIEGAGRYGRYLHIKAALGFLGVDNWKASGQSLATPTASAEVSLRY